MNSHCLKDSESAVVISCDTTLKPEHIICQIIGVDSLPDSIALNSNIRGYPWSFETKYYSAEINIYPLEDKVNLEEDFCNTVQAIIFYFDAQKLSSFEDVSKWLLCLKNTDAEVKLLVCNSCFEECSESPALERKNILKWCVENQFELVELNPPPETDDEEEGPFADAKGYGRVIEALQSHTWANLVMKEKIAVKVEEHEQDTTCMNEISDSNKEGTDSACCGDTLNACKSTNVDKKKISVEGEEVDLEEKWLNDVLSGEDPGGESFEALFSKFASMKDKAEGLAGEDRKKYAEKVAIAFWRAMGGDEDEIDGLDDLEN